jgi:hypothetical protein
MSDRIAAEHMQFDYRLITLSAIDYQLFLRAESPEEKMLGILANFRDHDRLEAVAGIVKEVFMASDGDLSRERYLFQLRILGNLRNLQSEINTIMESVAKWWKLERDPFYWKGEQDGIKKKTLEVVKSLLLNTNHTIAEIANLVNVPESFVLEVKTSLQS